MVNTVRTLLWEGLIRYGGVITLLYHQVHRSKCSHKLKINGFDKHGMGYFRWKGENVSTTEVSNILTDLDFIQDANVYGVTVPGGCSDLYFIFTL